VNDLNIFLFLVLICISYFCSYNFSKYCTLIYAVFFINYTSFAQHAFNKSYLKEVNVDISIYMNMYTAACNGINQSDYIFYYLSQIFCALKVSPDLYIKTIILRS
jgi:hypothetical protein